MVHRQRGELDETVVEQRIGTDQKCIGLLPHKARKGRIDLAIGAGVKDFALPPKGRSRRLHVVDRALSKKRRRRLLRCGISNRLMTAVGPKPERLFGGHTSGSAECRHGRQSSPLVKPHHLLSLG
jgi:hypothetical protein